MATIKYKKLDLAFTKKNYPILFDTIQGMFDNGGIEALDEVSLKKHIAGLCLEVALKSDGTPALFEDDLPSDLLGEEEDDNY